MALEKILIVEDNLVNRKLIETILKRFNYEILAATDGEEAIEIAQKDHPDLILMDIQLPKISGYEATQILRANPQTAQIPIIALTAQSKNDDVENIQNAHFDDFITKPIDTRTFPDQVRSFLENHASQNSVV